MVKGAIFFDYDGTLVDERDGILEPTKTTIETIFELQNNGYLCLLATGRAKSYIPKEIQMLNLDGIVACNGAYVEINNEVIVEDSIDLNILKDMINTLKQAKACFMLESAKYCYVSDLNNSNYLDFMTYYDMPKDNFIAYDDNEEALKHTCKVTIFASDEEERQKWREYYNGIFNISIHRGVYSMDLISKEINKGCGVKKLCHIKQIPFENTYAFGDGDNDYELLASVNCGIAMGLCYPSLLEVAKLHTSKVIDEGINQACLKLNLI